MVFKIKKIKVYQMKQPTESFFDVPFSHSLSGHFLVIMIYFAWPFAHKSNHAQAKAYTADQPK